MPFERYLQQPQPSQSSAVDDGYSHSSQQTHQQSNIHPQYDAHDGQLDSATFSRPIQFQMPQFMYAGPPTLALGGGAEVLPAGMFSSPAGMSSLAGNQWFQNSGFGKTGEQLYASSSSNDYSNHASLTIDPSAATASFQPYTSSPQSAVPPSPQQHQGPPPPPHTIVPSSVRQDGSGPMVVPHSLNQLLPHFGRGSIGRPLAPFTVPSALGLPVYSTSGFDLLSILARVATRPHPKIMLGPVDMSCSFVIVDTRRYDSPVVYASPSFYTLTGYPEHEVLGRNCRFLQAPEGNVAKGEKRQYTSPDAVAYMRKSLVADKECQTSMVNYRKNGSQFINLVSVIPVTGGVLNAPEESEEVVYHVGFQVDLTEQPSAILEKLKDGSYMVNYSTNFTLPPSSGLPPAVVVGSHGFGSTARDRRNASYASNAVSKDLRALLADPAFYSSASPHSHARAQIQSSSGDPSSPSSPTSPTNANDDSKPPTLQQQHEHYDSNNPLSLLLLDSSPDFVVVLSLKGTFLYVAPSVRRVLGFEPEELAGKSVVDFCHKSDVVPLMRELKESSGGGIGAVQSEASGQQGQGQGQGQSMFGGNWGGGPATGAGSMGTAIGMGAPKSVNFLFRAKTKGRVRWSFSVPASGSGGGKESETEGGEGEGDNKRKRKREGEDDGEEEGEYVWVECRGRLHIEPGKGRKAIILSARSREVPRLEWNAVGRAPPPAPASSLSPSSFPNASRLSKRARNGGDEMAAEKDGEGRVADGDGDEEGEKENEVWGIWSAGGTVLFMGAAVKDLLGWGVGEVIGMSVADLVGIGTSTSTSGAAMEWAGMSGYGGAHATAANGGSETQDVGTRQRMEERKKVEMALRKVVERSSSSAQTSSSVSPISGAYHSHSHPQQHQYAPTNMTATTSGSGLGYGYGYRAESESVVARMKRKDGYEVDLEVVFYPGNDENAAAALRESSYSASSVPLPNRSSSSIICQLRYPTSSSSSPHPRHPHPSRFESYPALLDRRGNIFEELETAKESSWQYELQQLKIANQRLAAEIEGMEGSVRGLEKERERGSEEVRRASVASGSGSGAHLNPSSNVSSGMGASGMGMGVAGPSGVSNNTSNNGTISLSMPIQLPIPVSNLPMAGSMQQPVYGHPQPITHGHVHGGMPQTQTQTGPNPNANPMPYSSYVGYEQSMRQHHQQQQQQAQAQMQQGWGMASHGHGGVPGAISGWGPASGGVQGSESSGLGGGMKRRWDEGGGV
ncbi:uncharacterized protein STEHIDRAFT_166722 [Stereum hirsutum FP-91666 SS1]|uniref:uncharacterized protein n=1 Tax=Stereum hirsutum (strain FP-91666) TaxID=721885 RepID=UPI000440E148|nr:uncharacterized protein STEHIDRAFT_166722 [Stereum hirsutum FP-91666 SS1]EIM88698.1 hypothetical protein STEHIDRAFT_166722 [Stereum hirsutum FP-91666 SS1]